MIFNAFISAGPWGRCWNPRPEKHEFRYLLRALADVYASEKDVWTLLLHNIILLCKNIWKCCWKEFNGLEKCRFSLAITVIFLSFRTVRSGQTVQTQIRLLLIRVCTVCNSLCIFWMNYSKETPSCSTFSVITTISLGVRIFRKFTVCREMSHFETTACRANGNVISMSQNYIYYCARYQSWHQTLWWPLNANK